MKYGLVAGALLAGCVARESLPPTTPRQVAAPTVLRSMALKVGQWASYQIRDHWNKTASTVQLVAVAAGDCGTWVRATVGEKHGARTWMLCIRDDGSTALASQVARALVDDNGNRHRVQVGSPGTYVRELSQLVTEVVPPLLVGAYGREDAWVPAGHFEQTLVAKDDDATTWLHPDVPFGGIVRSDDGHGRETLLAGYGDAGECVEQAFLAVPRHSDRPHVFWELGGGGDWFAGTAHVAASDTSAWRFSGGFLVGRFAPLLAVGGSSDAATKTSSFGLGLRWHTGLAGLYLQGVAGHVTHDVMGTTMADALTWSTGVGWLPFAINNVGFGVEVDHQLEWVNGGQELTQSASAMAILRLDIGR